ncbi:calcitonin gene-related peptide type 1 receptor-like [Crassostrea angulata]|uniref:calcitonin gene-related peptide type 1 receptor-like n=1 Tax=Magallana angulata TaxID=2784310 RepID=UPI0022B21662|nr:calcitonin gene-related peptide type 1 receptor-like [Crassostrea angulata]
MLHLTICLTHLELYNIVTSLFCYRLLLPHLSEQSKVYWETDILKTRALKATDENQLFPSGFSFVPDVNNRTSVDIACSGLIENDCERWVKCSKMATKCCEDYISSNASFEIPVANCPSIWDGMSCISSIPNGTVVSLDCPSYYIPTFQPAKFTKTCLSNGTWEKKAKLEVDGAHVLYNYTTCKEAGKQTLVVGKEEFRIHTLVTLVTNVISLAFLLPSIVIVALFRYSGSLDSGTRRMFRIRFHFLSSLILVSVVTLAWDWVVGKEHVDKLHKEDSLIEKNSPICKVLIILQLYLRSATYFWMFVEGLNILVPLRHSFQGKIRMSWFYFIGWGIPLITISIYALLRSTIQKYNFKCWIYHFKEIEWIVYVPNYVTVICNIVFLIVIMTEIVVKHRNTQSPSSYIPKSIRSFIFLVLLFGINFIFTWMFYAIYTDILVPYIINRVVDGLQGVFVCILWVFCSKQVQQNFKRAVSRKWSHVFVRFHARKFSTTSSTHLTQAIHPMSVTPIVLDNAKVSEHLKTTREVLEVPEMERLSPDEDRL